MYSPQNASGLPSETLSEFQYLSAKLRAWVAVDHNEDGTHRVTSASASNRLVGEIVMWGVGTAPSLWRLLDGTPLSRTSEQALFELWGTTYGVGDGSTTFGTPDMRQRVPLGKAASGTGNTLGATGGSIDHTHSFSGATTGAGGSHSHTASTGSASDHTHTFIASTSVENGFDTQAGTGADRTTTHQHTVSGTTDAGGSHSHTVTVDSASDHTHSLGSGSTGSGNMPYLVVNFIVYVGV